MFDDDTELHLLRQRNRVLMALCGLELDAEVELAAALIQAHARRAIERTADRRRRRGFEAFRRHARESLASAALLSLAFGRFVDHATRWRAATLLQSRVRGMRVRAEPSVRLLLKLGEERKRVLDLELSLLFLQRHQRVALV